MMRQFDRIVVIFKAPTHDRLSDSTVFDDKFRIHLRSEKLSFERGVCEGKSGKGERATSDHLSTIQHSLKLIGASSIWQASSWHADGGCS